MATKAQVNEFIKTVGAAALKEAQERSEELWGNFCKGSPLKS